MAIELIKIERFSLSGDITDFENYVGQFADCQTNMTARIEELSIMWDGPAKETFVLEFNKDCEVLNEIKSLLDEMVETMRYASGRYQECDNVVSTFVSGLKG